MMISLIKYATTTAYLDFIITKEKAYFYINSNRNLPLYQSFYELQRYSLSIYLY